MVSLLGEIVVLTHQHVFFSRKNGSLNNQNDDLNFTSRHGSLTKMVALDERKIMDFTKEHGGFTSKTGMCLETIN